MWDKTNFSRYLILLTQNDDESVHSAHGKRGRPTILHFSDGTLEEPRDGAVLEGIRGNRLLELLGRRQDRWRWGSLNRRMNSACGGTDCRPWGLRGGGWGHEDSVRADFADHRRRHGVSSVDGHRVKAEGSGECVESTDWRSEEWSEHQPLELVRSRSPTLLTEYYCLSLCLYLQNGVQYYDTSILTPQYFIQFHLNPCFFEAFSRLKPFHEVTISFVSASSTPRCSNHMAVKSEDVFKRVGLSLEWNKVIKGVFL